MGILGDWERPYLTMNFGVEADIIRALGKIAENGHLVKGYKPVYWSVVGGSALAEAEVEYQDKTSFSIDVAYPVTEAAQLEQSHRSLCRSSRRRDSQCSYLDHNALDYPKQSGYLHGRRSGIQFGAMCY